MKNVLNINKKYTVNDCKSENNNDVDEDDYIVKCIGSCGIWQILICVGVALTRFIGMWNSLSILFLTPAQSFKCVRFIDNSTIDAEDSRCYPNCAVYEHSQDIFTETVVSKFDLICERAWLANFTQTILMFGILLGVSFFGWLSDRFGRIKAVVVSGLTSIVFMVAIIFSPSYIMFLSLRFFIGISTGGAVSLSSVIISETLGPKYREMGVSLGLMPDGFSQATLAVFAYMSSTWKEYLTWVTAFSALIVFMLLFLPETPRWLVANGKADEAVQVLTRAAKLNKRSTANIKAIVDQRIAEIKTDKNNLEHHTYLDLFKTKHLFLLTMSSVIAWMISGFTYFGLNQYISLFGADLNVYLVVMILGLSTIPTVPLSMFVTKTFKRRPSAVTFFLIMSLSMFPLIFIPLDSWYSVILGATAIASSCVVVSVQFVYVTELYPTSMRNMGFSFSAAGIKLGALIAPFLTNVKPDWLSPFIFTILPVIAAVFTLFLPETKGKKLEDTLK